MSTKLKKLSLGIVIALYAVLISVGISTHQISNPPIQDGLTMLGGGDGTIGVLPNKVKISGSDTTSGYLGTKLVAGTGITFTINNPGANETLTITGSAAGITSLNGLTGSTQTFATGSSGVDFNISSSGTTHTFNIPTASASNRGLLSSTDWSTFNAKASTLASVSVLSTDATKSTYTMTSTIPVEFKTSGGTSLLKLNESTQQVTVQSITVGKGPGNIATNTVLGYQGLNSNNTGYQHTIIGYQAGFNMAGAANDNVAVGYQSLYTSNNYGNTAVGSESLKSSTGLLNTAIGYRAGYALGIGNSNVFVGQQSGLNLTSGGQMVLVGAGAGATYVSANNITGIGYQALNTSTGSANNAFGYRAAAAITSGSSNTYVGGFDGTGFLASNNQVFLSDGDGNVRMHVDSSGKTGLGGVGTGTISAFIHTIGTTEQLRLGYDTSNYLSQTISSTGSATWLATGSGSKHIFNDSVSAVPTTIDGKLDGNYGFSRFSTSAKGGGFRAGFDFWAQTNAGTPIRIGTWVKDNASTTQHGNLMLGPWTTSNMQNSIGTFNPGLTTLEATASTANRYSYMGFINSVPSIGDTNWMVLAGYQSLPAIEGIFMGARWQPVAGGYSTDWIFESTNDSRVRTTKMIIKGTSGNVGINVAHGSIAAKLHVIETTEQFRLGYDTANYQNFTVASNGSLTRGGASTAGTGLTATSGTVNWFANSPSFAPTSGTGIFNQYVLSPTINQTGGANGITRALYINPTLTAAADFRALELYAGTNKAIRAGYDASNYLDLTFDSSGNATLALTGTTPKFTLSQPVIFGSTARLKSYTVATLPTGTTGDTAYVTDALAPTYLTTIVGGGAIITPVFYNGTNWVAY